MHVLCNQATRERPVETRFHLVLCFNTFTTFDETGKKIIGFGDAALLVFNTNIDLKRGSAEWSDQPLDSQNLSFKLKTRKDTSLHL